MSMYSFVYLFVRLSLYILRSEPSNIQALHNGEGLFIIGLDFDLVSTARRTTCLSSGDWQIAPTMQLTLVAMPRVSCINVLYS